MAPGLRVYVHVGLGIFVEDGVLGAGWVRVRVCVSVGRACERAGVRETCWREFLFLLSAVPVGHSEESKRDTTFDGKLGPLYNCRL